jgi:hypothetical protein
MQRRLPEHAQTLPGLCLMMFVAWGLAITPTAWGDDFTLEPDPFESSSTLDSHVPSQNLLWQSTVKGFVSESTRPVGQARVAPVEKQPAPITIAERPLAKKQSAANPFTRWISPRSSDAKPAIPSADVTPTPETPSTEVSDSQAHQSHRDIILRDPTSAPEVARRTMPRARTTQPATPSRSQGRRIGEILDQERGPVVDDSDLIATPLNGYPEPQAVAEPQKEAEDKAEIVPVKLPPLTKNQRIMRDNVRRVLRYYYEHPMNTRDRSPWEVMHCALSYEVHSRMLQGGPQGKPVSAVGWLCFNQSCRRMKLMYVDEEGELNVKVGPALQGHRGQLLAILAQAKVSSEYPMQVDGHEFTIRDLIRAEMETCYPRTELTFKLIGLMHYLDSETQWVNDQGMQWNMRKLVSEELKQPIRGAACGGTHRLSGLTLAYKTRQARGESVDGEYAQAQRFVAQHQMYTFRTQNRDGSFSTNWFQGREDEEDIDRKLKTTGHMLEWLLYSSTDRELKSAGTTRAMYFLTNLMWQNRYRDWEAGPLGHAIHALVVYDRLMFSKYDAPGDSPMAIRDLTRKGLSTR